MRRSRASLRSRLPALPCATGRWKRHHLGENGSESSASFEPGDGAISAAGGGFSLALKDGGVIAWGGDNTYGQLDVVSISAGAVVSMALTASGQIFAWAYNFYHQLDIPAEAQCGASAISCSYHCLALI